MKLQIILLIGFTSLCHSARWAIDGSCDLVAVADPGNGLSPFIQASESIKTAFQEALKIAKSADIVMTNHANDPHVKDMLALLLGEGDGFQAKFDAAKGTFQSLLGFDEELASDRPMDPAWQSSMSSNDVMIFCGSGRIRKMTDKKYIDTSTQNTAWPPLIINSRARCYLTNYDAAHPTGSPKAFTVSSDFMDWVGYKGASEPKRMDDFKSPRPHVAFTMDLCAWWLHANSLQNWPTISRERIAITQQPGFVSGPAAHDTPIDGLENMSLTFLHELTHTLQGGKLDDIKTLPPPKTCYGWKCTQELKDPQNADNISMLGLALHLWTMGYYVDADGNIKDKAAASRARRDGVLPGLQSRFFRKLKTRS